MRYPHEEHGIPLIRVRLRSFGFVCAALALTLWLGGGALAQTSNANIEQAVGLLRSRQYPQALRLVDQLLTAQPNDCRLLSLRGLTLTDMQHSGEAAASFKQALGRCPNNLLALEGLAQIEYAHHSPDTAILLQRILALRPGDPTTEAMFASFERGNGKCKDALPHFEAARSLIASNTKFHQDYAFCLAKTGNYSHAATEYEQLLAAAPSAAVRYDLAFVQWKLHGDAEALQTLQPLLKDAQNEAVLALGARLSEETGNTPQAVKLLRAAILLQPKNLENYLEFAQIAFNHHSFQVGIDMINAGLTQLPQAAQLYVARGVLEAQLSQMSEAMADFEHAHKLDPQLALAMDSMGIAESQRFKQAASLDLFRKQAQLHPKSSLSQYLYAEALSNSDPGVETTHEAIEAAHRSVAADPAYAPAHDLLALLYLRIKQPKQALAEAQAAFHIDPTDSTALYHEIMARRELGQTQQVKALVKQFVALRSKNAKAERAGHRYVLKD